MTHSFAKSAAAIAAGFAAISSAAQAQSAPTPTHHTASIEQIYLLLDANQDRFEAKVIAKAEAALTAKTAKIENFWVPAGASQSFVLASIQPFTDCAL